MAAHIDLTVLLARAQKGERAAWCTVYESTGSRLREIAARLMYRERPGHILTPTALVSESFLRLRRILAPFLCREHFYSMSALIMKRVLVDQARRNRVLDPSELQCLARQGPSHGDPATLLAVRQAFERLDEFDPTAAAAIRLRLIDGHTIAETSGILGREPWDVRRDCDFGLKWMAGQLRQAVRSSD